MAGSADHATTTTTDEDRAVAELDQIIARRKSRAAASTVKRKVRMSEEHIALIKSVKKGGIPSDDDGLELLSRHYPELYTPEVVEEKRREHEELVAMCRRDDEENEARQAEIMRELSEKGYVETDEVDQTYVDEFNEWTRVQWESMVSSSEILKRGMRISDEENAEALKNFLSRQAEEEEDYYSDEDDDYYSDEDDDDDDDDDETVESSDVATVGSCCRSDAATVESSDAAAVESSDRLAADLP